MRRAVRWVGERVLALVLINGFFASISLAQEQPIVRVTLSPESVAVGEAANMRVTVLVPTWFASPPVYPSFEIANAITRLPPDSSFSTSERIGDAVWSGIVRDYRIYPLLSATYRISDQRMQISHANPGGQPSSTEVAIPDIVLDATVPAGAEDLSPYLAGRELRFSRVIQGEVASLSAGDAIVVVYTAELDGMPAMFLPPLAPDVELNGASIYADTPLVEDGPPARRSEKLTLVFESGGEYTLPGRTLDWWNTTAGRVERASVAAVTFPVDGPKAATGRSETGREVNWILVVGSLVVLGAIVFSARHGITALANRWRARLQAHRQSERYAFKELRQALRHGDAKAAYRTLLRWLDRLEAGLDARGFASTYGTHALEDAMDRLVAAGYSTSSTAPNLSALETELATARNRWTKSRSPATVPVLPGLNP